MADYVHHRPLLHSVQNGRHWLMLIAPKRGKLPPLGPVKLRQLITDGLRLKNPHRNPSATFYYYYFF